MSGSHDCCKPQAVPTGQATCPRCGAKGKKVPEQTPRHLVKPEAKHRLRDVPYLFCQTPTCPVVYFAEGADDEIEKHELIVRVGIKENEPPRLVCYCFGHTVEQIEEEIGRTGAGTVVEEVRKKIKEGLCECEIRNPEGSCCLGDLTRVAEAAKRQKEDLPC